MSEEQAEGPVVTTEARMVLESLVQTPVTQVISLVTGLSTNEVVRAYGDLNFFIDETLHPYDHRYCMGCGRTQAECDVSCPARLAGGWER